MFYLGFSYYFYSWSSRLREWEKLQGTKTGKHQNKEKAVPIIVVKLTFN